MLDSDNLKSNDHVILIGGTNDIGCSKESDLILASIPPRYDLSPYSLENKSIRSLNKKLNNLVRQSKSNVRILDLGSKIRNLFTMHGLNLKARKIFLRI